MFKQVKKIAVAYSAHAGSDKDNLGDVLSAVAIAEIAGLESPIFNVLPRDIGKSTQNIKIYGGGGMIRPNFAAREVYADYQTRKGVPYAIYGVGLNRDIGTEDFNVNDLTALELWIRNAQSVTVRDWATQFFLKDSLGFAALVAPCPTYTSLRLRMRRVRALYTVGVSLSLGHTKVYATYKQEVIELTNQIIRHYGADKVLIICHDASDYTQAVSLWGETVACEYPKTLDEVAQTYSRCQSVLTFRGHGLIFAAAAGVPCSPVLLNIKLGTLYEYHYGIPIFGLSFNLRDHIAHLGVAQKPIDLKVDLSVFQSIKQLQHEGYEEKLYAS